MEEQSVNSIDGTFSYSQIVEITSSFKTLLGEGGFGKVYRGTLNDDTYVAVKVLSGKSGQDYKQFQAEVKLLKIVHHKNLVSLLGYCNEDDIMALIYEYVANGNLEQYLSEKSKIILSWKSRLQIAIDVAEGLEYLHDRKPPIIHRDLKPPNILLTKDMRAKIADFGLSRTFTTDSASHISTKLAGTFGYLDPETFKTGCVRKESDIYSFGIILLQLITGKPAVIKQDEDNKIHITDWIDPLIESKDIRSIVDTRLKDEFNIDVAKKAIEIAMLCVKPIIEGLNMSRLWQELHKCLDIEMGPRVLGETNRLNNGMKSRNSTLVAIANQVEAEWIEEYEPGVYLTLVALQDGTRDLKRVRFSRRRFEEHQAEIWWSENKKKVYAGYNVCGLTNRCFLDKLPDANRKESGSTQDGENGMKCRNSTLVAVANQDEAEWIEEYSTASDLLSSLSASQEVANGKESGLSKDGENGVKSRNLTLVAVANQVEAEWIEEYSTASDLLSSLSASQEDMNERESGPSQDGESGVKSRNSTLVAVANQVEAEWIEEYSTASDLLSSLSASQEDMNGKESGPCQDGESGVKSGNSTLVTVANQVETEWIEEYSTASDLLSSLSTSQEVANGKESGPSQDGENGVKSRNSTLVAIAKQVEAEWIEEYEPGIYLTLVALQDGTRDLKRVRFSRRRFEEHQADIWWLENREKVYNVCGLTNCQSLNKLPDANRKESKISTLIVVANQVEAEWIEEYEPGVYLTLVALQDGTRDLKRVRFSRRRFKEDEAEIWWSKNRKNVYKRYNIVRGSDNLSDPGQTARRSGED